MDHLTCVCQNFLSTNTPGDKILVTPKRCALSSSWNTCTRNILSGVRTLLPVNSHQSWKRGRENLRDALFLTFFGRLRLFRLSPPARREDGCPESLRQRSPGWNQPLWSHPHRIRDSALLSQWRTEHENTPSLPKGWIERSIDWRGYLWLNVAHSECACVSFGHLKLQLLCCYFLQRC